MVRKLYLLLIFLVHFLKMYDEKYNHDILKNFITNNNDSAEMLNNSHSNLDYYKS